MVIIKIKNNICILQYWACRLGDTSFQSKDLRDNSDDSFFRNYVSIVLLSFIILSSQSQCLFI